MIKEYLEHLLLKESFIIQNLLTQDLFWFHSELFVRITTQLTILYFMVREVILRVINET